MSADRAATPCAACGAWLGAEQAVCTVCGAARREGRLSEVPTSPGAPLVRGAKRARISSHDYVPLTLAREYEELKRERAERAASVRLSRFARARVGAIAGLALVAFPFAVPAFVFLPSRGDAATLLVLNAGLGAAAGGLAGLAGGGTFKSVLLFAAAFAGAIALLARRGFPYVENPAAIAVLASTALFSLLVAGVLGSALDEDVSDS